MSLRSGSIRYGRMSCGWSRRLKPSEPRFEAGEHLLSIRSNPSREHRIVTGRHCEERSDEAIQTIAAVAVWIASLALAMTVLREPSATTSSVPRHSTRNRRCSQLLQIFEQGPALVVGKIL